MLEKLNFHQKDSSIDYKHTHRETNPRKGWCLKISFAFKHNES